MRQLGLKGLHSCLPFPALFECKPRPKLFLEIDCWLSSMYLVSRYTFRHYLCLTLVIVSGFGLVFDSIISHSWAHIFTSLWGNWLFNVQGNSCTKSQRVPWPFMLAFLICHQTWFIPHLSTKSHISKILNGTVRSLNLLVPDCVWNER